MFDKKNRGPNADTVLRWLMLGSVACIAIYAAFVMEPDDNVLVNLFGAFCIAIGAGTAIAVFSLIGGLIDRLVLGNQDDEDTAGTVRYAIFFGLLVVLIFSIVQFC